VEIPEPVLRWQRHVHQPGIYDLEIDTSTVTPKATAALIRNRLVSPTPSAFPRLAADLTWRRFLLLSAGRREPGKISDQ